MAVLLALMALLDDTQRDAAIARAMASTKAAIAKAEADPERPGYHFRAPALWMNDPNGPFYANGWYHVFYQFNPYGDRWGNMHWGHARSRNLLDWEHLPVALWPSKERGEDHIYSGSCFMGPKGPIAYYTSISDKRPPEQWAALPDDKDFIRWHKAPENPVVTSTLEEWRDPFIFAKDGQTYLITGGGEKGHGIVALYRARDASLMRWEPAGILFRHPDADVRNIECPNFAKIGSKWLLLVSVHGRVEAFLGDLDASMEFKTSWRGVLNEGSYASQLVTGPKGQVTHLAWVPTDYHSGWNGYMSLPATLSLDKAGNLRREPIPALKGLRGKKVSMGAFTVDGKIDLSHKMPGEQVEVVARVDATHAFSIQLRGAVVRYPEAGTAVDVHLYLDRTVVEDAAGPGHTYKFRQTGRDAALVVSSDGGPVKVLSMDIYSLRSAKFDLSHFN